jgi:hypothetical protein
VRRRIQELGRCLAQLAEREEEGLSSGSRGGRERTQT